MLNNILEGGMNCHDRPNMLSCKYIPYYQRVCVCACVRACVRACVCVIKLLKEFTLIIRLGNLTVSVTQIALLAWANIGKEQHP